MRELTKNEKMILHEKACEIGMFENTASDNKYSPEEMLDSFPEMLDDTWWTNQFYKEFMEQEQKRANRGFYTNIAIKFASKDIVIDFLLKEIRKMFPYTDTRKSLDERKELFKNIWCF